jgi:hypothetical protein
MNRNSLQILIVGLILALGVVNAPTVKAQGSITFWERGVGTDYGGAVAIISGGERNVIDLGTCYTVSTTNPVTFSFSTPLVVDSNKQYVWIYTISDTTPPITTRTGTVPADMNGNIFGFYETQYLVTISSTDGGSTDPSGSVMMSAGDSEITATAESEFNFVEWTSTGSVAIADPYSASTTATISGPGTIKANFEEIGSTPKYLIRPSAIGSGSITPSSPTYVNKGSSKTFTFSPDEGFMVSEIKVDENTVPVATSYTFSNVKADHKIEVTFSAVPQDSVSITLDSNPSGQGFLKIDGAPVATPATFEWVIGSTHTLEAVSVVNGAAGVRYAFSSWDDAGPIIHDYTVTTSASIKATYGTQYRLTMKTNFGTVTPPDGSWLAAGSKVTLKATAPSVAPSESYVFGGWKGSLGGYTGGVNPSAEFTINGPVTEETTWEHIYELVIESPVGTTEGAGWYEVNQVVSASVTQIKVTEGSNTQSTFLGWSGDAQGTDAKSDNIVMNGPKKAIALWQTQYRLVFSQTGLEGGIFGVNDGGILTINGAKYGLSEIPYVTGWINSGDVVNYSFSNSETSAIGGVFNISKLNGPQSPISVGSAVTITAEYGSSGFAFTYLNIVIILIVLLAITLGILYLRNQNK